MIVEQFLLTTKNMVLTHLYFDEKRLDIFDALKNTHPHFQTYDIQGDIQKIPTSDFFFIEIGESTKDKLKILLGVLTKHKPIATYLFADDVENRLLLKFALHFGIADVLPLDNHETLLASIFTKNPNKLDDKLSIFNKIAIGNTIEHCFPFFIFKDDSLIYANTKAQILYEETNLSVIEERLLSDEDLFKLLQNDKETQLSLTFENDANEKIDYLCFIKSFPPKNEKILSMIPYKLEERVNTSVMLNRFDFIETLKDKLAEQSIGDKRTSFILINISNLDKLNQLFKSTVLHESFKKFLNKIFHLKEENQEVVQWSPNLYIIVCENLSFERVCEQTRYVQQELINVTVEEKITPIIISSALMANHSDLNETLGYIEKISIKKMLPEDIEKVNFYQIDYLENILDEQEQISYLMRNCVNNKIPIKLLNIYKGLCINTNSHILKINEDTYHLYCENLQGYAMQLEGDTVLQAPNFSKDIKAEVSFVDIKKSLVILKNLTFTQHSANNRQHTRVQTSIRTPILIKYGNKASAQGEICDISVNSVAIRVSKSIKEDIKNQTIKLNFSLPNEEGENGYIVMDIEAKVTFVAQHDEYTKVVVMLGALHKPYDDYLLHYMYTRQKELILEIRRASKVYN